MTSADTANPSLDSQLKGIYYDPKSPASYSGAKKLYTAAKELHVPVTHEQIRRWLANQYTYQVHKKTKKKFRRRQVAVSGIKSQLDADLMDLGKLRHDQCQYLLIVINVFTRKLFVAPLLTKTSKEVTEAMSHISQRSTIPKKIRTDQGKEFVSSVFQNLMSRLNIKHFTSLDYGSKANFTERVIRTLRNKIQKYLTENKTTEWLSELPNLVCPYNSTTHSSTRVPPDKLTNENESQVWYKLFGHNYQPRSLKKESRLNVGTFVRITKSRGGFSKDSDKTFSSEVFVVTQVRRTNPTTHELEDLKGELIQGGFYRQELQPVDRTQLEKREIAANSKRKGGKHYVSYKSWPPKYNETINETAFHDYLLPHHDHRT